MDNILEITNLCKNFASFKLDNVSFSLPKGFIMGFIGPNGAGKTTTIKSILGSLKIDSGHVKIFGKDPGAHNNEIKENIGIVMDTPYLVEEWTLSEIESIVGKFYSNWDRVKYFELLNKFALDKKKKLSELSKGMKTKLMITTALSHDAKLLILDEPTSGLDPVARDELMDILQDFISEEDRSVLLSTHITSDLEKLSDFITFIKDGKILFTGEKDEMLDKYLIIKGGPDDITKEIKEISMGLKAYETGFSALILKENSHRLPPSILSEKPSIEDIMIYTYRGEQ